MRVYSVVGPSHCGSTLLFNLLRFILTVRGVRFDSCFVDEWPRVDERGRAEGLDVLLVKAHVFDEGLAGLSCVAFLAIRDCRDAVLTYVKRTGNDADDAYTRFCSTFLEVFRSWEPYAGVVWRYEDHRAEPAASVRSLGRVLNMWLMDAEVEAILRMVEDQKRDPSLPETDLFLTEEEHAMLLARSSYGRCLLTKSHMTAGGATNKYLTDMPHRIHAAILDVAGVEEYLRSHGYLVEAWDDRADPAILHGE